MAHLLEHMIFKGTTNLSESDINVVCQKLTGDANAFTSQDYTCYTFRLPSNAWQVGISILAECMQNATFNPQMLSSELKAVIEELRLYRDDYQGVLVEQMITSLFPEHPYRNSIIGTKADLCNLNRDDLYAFYKKHYHPRNAVLVVAGDVDTQQVFEVAERDFGYIPSPEHYEKEVFAFRMISSRAAPRSIARLMLPGFITIGVWPINDKSRAKIEKIVEEELALLCAHGVHDWEFTAAKKRTLVDFSSLLESTERQAFVIGNSFVATRDEHFVEKYLAAVTATTKQDLIDFFRRTFNQSQVHKGYLLPITKPEDMKTFVALQAESDALETNILANHTRTLPVEQATWANTLTVPGLPSFSYPKPQTYACSNGMEIVYHNNQLVPQVVCLLSFKANHLYESDEQSGIIGFLLRVITDSSQSADAQAFAQMLESEGISLGASGDGIVIRCLSKDFEKALTILSDLLLHPSLRIDSIEKTRQQIISEIDELWDSPIDFIDQMAKELVYQSHPYHKNGLGSKESINRITKKDLEAIYRTFITPHETVVVVVGDIGHVNLPERFAAPL
ncbi:unnamed protein product [Sphagnum tenellum]